MIIQMGQGTNDKISVRGNKLICAGFVYHMGNATRRVTEKSFNLENWRGKIFRLWIGQDGKLSTVSRTRQFALLAEVSVPPRSYREVRKDDEGNPVLEVEPLEPEELQVKVWPLPG